MTTHTVEMVRDAAESGGRDRFSCTIAAWRLVFDLGQAFGWRPLGTTYLPRAGSVPLISARHDYQPGERSDQKQVTADDAIAWAKALDNARRSSHFAAMIAMRLAGGAAVEDAPGEETHDAIAACADIIDEFIEYAYGGEFAFAAGPD